MMPTPELHASCRADQGPSNRARTGSIAANGPRRGRLLNGGDVMESTVVTCLGRQRNRCVSERPPETAPGQASRRAAT